MRVTLNGYVAADEDLPIYHFFKYPAFGPSTVRQALEDCPADEELVFEINSYGGSVFSGGEIYNKDGVLYYYENGKPADKGLPESLPQLF